MLYGPNVMASVTSRGLVFMGSCDDDMAGSTTAIHVRDLRGFSNDFFNTKFYMIILKDYNDVGDAPEGECRQITDYVSDTGVFTTAAFTANVEAHDLIMVVHETVALLASHADATGARIADDSWLARLMAQDGDVSAYDDTTMSLEAIAALITNANQQTNMTAVIDADDLNHLINTAMGAALDTVMDDDAVLGHLSSVSDVSDFDRTTDSQEAIGTALINATLVASTTEELNAAAGAKDLFTGTTADVILLGLTMRNATVDLSDDVNFTGISIQTDDVTPATIISQADGVKANLTSEATLGWDGGHAGLYIKLGTKIQLTIYGGAADENCAPDIAVVYKPLGAGTGTLAP